MENMLGQESVTMEKNGIKLTINGNFKITELTINDQKAPKNPENDLKDLFNEAVKKIQRIIARKMQETGGLGSLGSFGG